MDCQGEGGDWGESIRVVRVKVETGVRVHAGEGGDWGESTRG